jgi:hypothetical protein
MLGHRRKIRAEEVKLGKQAKPHAGMGTGGKKKLDICDMGQDAEHVRGWEKTAQDPEANEFPGPQFRACSTPKSNSEKEEERKKNSLGRKAVYRNWPFLGQAWIAWVI